jgi:hypothetical protein
MCDEQETDLRAKTSFTCRKVSWARLAAHVEVRILGSA